MDATRANLTSAASGGGDAYDVIVIGAGGGGMAAALFAAIRGSRVLLLESTEQVGGTTSYSGGTTWIPNTHLAAAVSADDSVEQARTYLTHVIGPFLDSDRLESFLRNGPKAIAILEQQSDVRFRAFPLHPDYESDVDGASTRGRALEPLPFDGRMLGHDFALVRPPIPEFTVLSGMMVDRQDIGHLMKLRTSWSSFRYSLRILARHLRDRMQHPRGTRLVMGNALIARLLYSLRQRGAEIQTLAAVTGVHRAPSGGFHVAVTRAGRDSVVRATSAVILAAGGFNRNARLRRERLGTIAPYTPTAPGNTGGGIELGESLGGRMGADGYEPVLWAPVSVRKRPDGSVAVFPHFIMDRAKPGTVVVNQAGRRFLNEAVSYHQFGHAMHVANALDPCVPAYLIADREAVQKYGLGMVRPGTRDLSAFVADGYVIQANTIDELAGKLGMPQGVLNKTVEEFNRYAVDGIDRQFGRGTTVYQRNIGDPQVAPNPNYGPLRTAPFHAVRIYPGDIGASSGLVTDGNANVLDHNDQPIRGLYAVGNDMHSVMGGAYPGPGITLGPAIAFAYAAIEHALAACEPASSKATHAAVH